MSDETLIEEMRKALFGYSVRDKALPHDDCIGISMILLSVIRTHYDLVPRIKEAGECSCKRNGGYKGSFDCCPKCKGHGVVSVTERG